MSNPLRKLRLPLLCLALTLSSYAQEDRWKNMVGQADKAMLAGRYTEAKNILQQALPVAEALGRDHRYLRANLRALGKVLFLQGRYAEARPIQERLVQIIEQSKGGEHYELAAALNESAETRLQLLHFVEAEALFQRAAQIEEKFFGPEHIQPAFTRMNLAQMYQRQGKYAEAEVILRQVVLAMQRARVPTHPDRGKSLALLANGYARQGKRAEAESLYRRSLQVAEAMTSKQHPAIVEYIFNLATVVREQDRLAEAESLYGQADRLGQSTLGPHHTIVGRSALGLSALYSKQGRYPEAEAQNKRAIEIFQKSDGHHPLVADAAQQFAQLLYVNKRPAEALAMFELGFEVRLRQFQYHFTYMTERERLGFLETVADSFPVFFSFCYSNRERDPNLLGRMYDVVLWRKGFVAASVAALRSQIIASGDREALALLDELSEKKTQIAQLLTSPPEDREEGRRFALQLEAEAGALERKLALRSQSLAEEQRLARVSWRDIQRGLAPGEAAVEVVRFPFHDGQNLTGAVYYVALILTKDDATGPRLVLIGDAKRVESDLASDYKQRVSLHATLKPGQPELPPFLGDLETELGKNQRVYLAPDGILNQMAIGVLPSAQGGLLMDRFDIRLVSNTRELLRGSLKSASASAILIGAPEFGMRVEDYKVAVRTLRQGESGPAMASLVVRDDGMLRSRDQQRGQLSPLPGTKIELDAVAPLLKKHGWRVEVYSESRALEEAVKQVKGPRLLHIASHGFFLPDQSQRKSDASADPAFGRENPMLRSGLYFSGADRTLAGTSAETELEDGILTAYEAAGLNLQGTELVVLSACETGLGVTQNGEGVFGLRRALQIAGAEAILMSMWAVSDRETEELMTLFYSNWLAGKSKHDALAAAQKEMRARVRQRYQADLPFYWAAFVLQGR